MAIRDALTRPRNWASGTAILLAAIVEASLWIPGFYDELVAWQTAIAAFFGFGGLIAAALFGFRNVIRAQEHQAELARYRDEAGRAVERRSLAAALRGELLAARARVAVTPGWVEDLQEMMESNALDDDKEVAIGGHPAAAFTTSVFQARAGDLGLLPATTAAEVAEVYGLLSWWMSFARPEREKVRFGILKKKLRAAKDIAENLEPRIDALAAALYKIAVPEKRTPEAGKTGN